MGLNGVSWRPEGPWRDHALPAGRQMKIMTSLDDDRAMAPGCVSRDPDCREASITARRGWPILFCLLMAACSAPGQSLAQPDRPGAVRVGLTGDYPPFCMHRDGAGTWQGYAGLDVAMLQAFRRELPVSPKLQGYQWPELSRLMASGALDLAVCGITQRRDRTLSMAFTRPYAVGGAVVAMLPVARSQYPTLAAIDRPGVRLAVNAGGHLERVARERFPRAAIHTTTDNLALRRELEAGLAEGVIADLHEARRWPGVRLIGPFTRDLKVMAVALDQPGLRAAINDWLAAREADGWLEQQRWNFLGARGWTPAQSCSAALSGALELRYSLMPWVAGVKRREGVPLADPQQEQSVLAKARLRAERLGLSPDAATRLFGLLIDQSKRLQARRPETVDGQLTLAELRRAIGVVSESLLPEIRRCALTLDRRGSTLAASLRERLAGWLTEGEIEELLEVLPPRAGFMAESGAASLSSRAAGNPVAAAQAHD